MKYLVGILVAVVSASCAGVGRYESDFPVLVVNRTASTIQAMANGNALGTVASGQSQSFSLTLRESSANVFVNGVAPTPQADVTFAARDTRTGNLSREKNVTLLKDTPTSVTFEASDFPETAPTRAAFNLSPTNPTINQDVSFNAAASSGSNLTYNWDFGDQTAPGSGVQTTHRYLRGGTFTVTLTVTSDTRQQSTASRTVTVSTTLPAQTANFTFSPTNPSINQDVIFTGSGTAPGPGQGPFPLPGAPAGATYNWDFGDGTTGTGQTQTHRYARGGTYAVTLRVTTEAGLTATQTRQITISTTLPAGSANFVFSPTDPQPGDTVFFNATSSTIADATYSWDFGDGDSGAGLTTTHVYSTARTFTVTLVVRNQRGQSASVSKTVTVAVPAD
ncbi:MAG: PKD domain-containing protein [Acidimicrobiia bacterium]|nr:PKD domain-containing protein [Acidimicrobiia bacterium]